MTNALLWGAVNTTGAASRRTRLPVMWSGRRCLCASRTSMYWCLRPVFRHQSSAVCTCYVTVGVANRTTRHCCKGLPPGELHRRPPVVLHGGLRGSLHRGSRPREDGGLRAHANFAIMFFHWSFFPGSGVRLYCIAPGLPILAYTGVAHGEPCNMAHSGRMLCYRDLLLSWQRLWHYEAHWVLSRVHQHGGESLHLPLSSRP